MSAIIEIILPVFVVVGFGYAVAWKGLFNENAVDGLVAFTQKFAIPCLLFAAISRLDLTVITSVPLIASYYVGAFASFFLAFVCARLFFDRNPMEAVAIGFCGFFSNTILLGLPITERAYGPEALSGNFAIITFHAPLLYFLGVTAMEFARSGTAGTSEKAARVLRAMFHNQFVIAIGLGLLVNVTALPLPAPLVKSVDMIASAALPAALFGLGGLLARYKPEGDFRAILMVCVISLVVHPLVVFGAGTALSLDQDAMRSAVLTAAMAPGVNTYLFANMYGAARRVAATSVLIATALSVVSVWAWLLVLP